MGERPLIYEFRSINYSAVFNINHNLELEVLRLEIAQKLIHYRYSRQRMTFQHLLKMIGVWAFGQ